MIQTSQGHHHLPDGWDADEIENEIDERSAEQVRHDLAWDPLLQVSTGFDDWPLTRARRRGQRERRRHQQHRRTRRR